LTSKRLDQWAIKDFDRSMSVNPGNQFVRHDRQLALERAEEEGA
jgi:hypothetical protein